jgi:hypothetical protein
MGISGRLRIGLGCVALALVGLSTGAPVSRDPHRAIAVSDLVPATDPLHAHALRFEVADQDALAVIERMSGGERLWYRVGARMAARLEQARGRSAMVTLVTQKPERLVPTYRQIVGR